MPKKPLIRAVYASLVAISALVAAVPAAAADTISLVVPYAPGGITDSFARLIAKRLGEELKASVVVENKPGAGTAIGAAHVAKAAPDGSTLMLTTVSTTLATNPLLMDKPPYAASDLVPVAPIASAPFVLLATSSLPASNVKELIALGKQGKRLNCATVGPATTGHLTNVMFRKFTGLQCPDVHYKGSGPATTDLLAGTVELYFDGLSSAVPRIKAGQVKALAVTGTSRSAALPGVPTVAEAGFPKFVSVSSFGVLAPAKTPKATLERINAAINRVVAEPEIRNKLLETGAELGAPVSLADYRKQVDVEATLWKSVVDSMDAASLK